MKRLILAALGLLLLAGCGRTQLSFETVDDQWAEPVLAEAPYAMVFAVPADAELEQFSSSETYRNYLQENGDYELTCQILPSGDREGVIRQISGHAPEELQIMKTTKFDMPEEQFCWVAEDGFGLTVCRAAILEDDGWFYVLTSSVRAEQANAHSDSIEQAFASLGLYTDEEF